jgi:hypothetical protein
MLFDNWRLSDRVDARRRMIVLVIHHNESVNDGALLASVLLAIVDIWIGLDAGHDALICFCLCVVVSLFVCVSDL